MSLWTEIEEQPAVLERLLRASADQVADIVATVWRNDIRFVVIAARGTSDNTARYAQYLFGARNGLPVALATPSLFTTYRRPPSLDAALVIAISQSGRSPDLVAVVEEARRHGRPTLAVTNDPASPLADASDHVLDLAAGPELAVAATKTYTAQLLAIGMLSAAAASDQEMVATLATLPEHAAAMLGQADRIRDLAHACRDVDRCVVIGRGYNLSTAYEWALKLQELCYLPALPFSSADFEHGPLAMVDRGFPVLAVLPPGPLRGELSELLARLRDERGAELLMISDEGGDIDLPASVPEWASPVVAILGAQIFAYHLTVAKGLDPDTPRGLTKVTRTW